MSVSVILNTGAIAAGLVPLAFIQKPQNPMTQTLVAIGVGSGGSVPHVAIWDDDGNRITHSKEMQTVISAKAKPGKRP